MAGGGKGGGSETVTTQLDPQTQKYVEWMRGQAKYGSDQVTGGDPSRFFKGPNAGMRDALQGIQGITPGAGFDQFMSKSGTLAGRLGQDFDPSSIQSFMDPYRKDVIAGQRGLFADQRGQAGLAAKDLATSAGAFGGSRSALLESSMVGDVNRQESSTIANLLSGGYSQAQNAALGIYGMQQQQGAQGMQNLLAGTQFRTGLDFQKGQAGFAGNELFRQLSERQAQAPVWARQQGMNFAQAGVGPYGQTQTATGSGPNYLAGAFGGAMMLPSLFKGGE